ncbi:11708_t:CDS:1 [Paraglomus brasilianum]|uniref:Protein-serine/threonine kinase n=1 Tax=Paraglomus brasilianum TaxID=144538 RepID=A0A9N8ZNE0_9GLOM|nr:11708_t:CDS:1 [Paraglomus brasilianum]
MARRTISPQHFYQNRILDQYASQSAKTITLRQLAFFGRNLNEDKLIQSGNYVRKELPVRLAHRIRDFQNLPFIVGTNSYISTVYELYWSAFDRLRSIPEIKTIEDNHMFCETLKGLLREHLVALPQLARGMMECSNHISQGLIDRFMYTMLRSRISRRVLAEQQIALTANWNKYGHSGFYSDGRIGVVNTKCNARDTVERCATVTRDAYRTYYGVEPPEVVFDGRENVVFTYIPDHIEYVLYELLKNSIRGVIETHSSEVVNNVMEATKSDVKVPEATQDTNETEEIEANPSSAQPSSRPHFAHEKIPHSRPLAPSSTSASKTSPYPHISVTVSSSPTDIYFRISDQGGGIPESIYPHIWSFPSLKFNKFTNLDKVSQMAATLRERQEEIIPPMLKLGIGLPMSKVYCEYWGGGLIVFSMDGYGTDAYIKITRLGNKEENLV